MFVFILCSLSVFAGVNLYTANLRERTLRQREVGKKFPFFQKYFSPGALIFP
jgi:hypothetical protein